MLTDISTCSRGLFPSPATRSPTALIFLHITDPLSAQRKPGPHVPEACAPVSVRRPHRGEAASELDFRGINLMEGVPYYSLLRAL